MITQPNKKKSIFGASYILYCYWLCLLYWFQLCNQFFLSALLFKIQRGYNLYLSKYIIETRLTVPSFPLSYKKNLWLWIKYGLQKIFLFLYLCDSRTNQELRYRKKLYYERRHGCWSKYCHLGTLNWTKQNIFTSTAYKTRGNKRNHKSLNMIVFALYT